MRLLVPSSTLRDTENVLAAGADDIYIGASTPFFHRYSFNGRSNYTKGGRQILPPPEQIRSISKAVHSANGLVYFLANIPLVNGASHRFRLEFMRYVDAGINAGADYVVLGDLSAIQWVKDAYPQIKIVASSYLEVQNEWTLHLLEELGVDQAVLSYQCGLEDIKRLCAGSKLKIEVFGHGGCSFYVGSCNMFHELGESHIHMGYPCRGLYRVRCGEKSYGAIPALDCFKMCSLCKLKELMDCGVYSLKIVGRDLSPQFILQVVKTYADSMKHMAAASGRSGDAFHLPAWWKKSWCDAGNLCRYGRGSGIGHHRGREADESL